MTVPLLTAAATYARIRGFGWRVRDRQDLGDWQARRIARWLARDVPMVSAYRRFADRPIVLTDLPIVTKADHMADFAAYNRLGLTAAEGWAAFEGSRMVGDHVVGASTGTSGNRGLFVVSGRERFAWLGAILAKALPDAWRHRDRVAVLLPLDTPLYDSANRTRRLAVRFFDTSVPLSGFADELRAFDPTVVIAPPRKLREIGDAGLALRPRRVLSAAEKIEAFDREAIERAFGIVPGEIYMATEGLLGVTCRHGRLHLAEDCMHFELEPAGNGLVSPILSDFSRSAQIMARYRLNDLLALDPRPCPCGSPLQAVREVVGRCDDVFLLAGRGGGDVVVTPDILRNVVVDADRRIDDFRIVQTGPERVELHLPSHLPAEAAGRVRAGLAALLERHGGAPVIVLHTLSPGTDAAGPKLRRVENRWRRDGSRWRRDGSRWCRDESRGRA